MADDTGNLGASVTQLRGIGPALAGKLERLDVYRVEDLLFMLPLRYEDRTRLTPIGSLRPGDRCLVSGEVLLAETVYRGRRSLLVRISDGTGQLTLRFFYFSRQQEAQFKTGSRVSCFGDARLGRGGVEMIHPEYRLLREDQDPVTSDRADAGLFRHRGRAAGSTAESGGPGPGRDAGIAAR